MKHSLLILFSGILLLASCKSDTKTDGSQTDQKETSLNEEDHQKKEVEEKVIQQKQVEAIVEKKIAKAMSADDKAREASLFNGMSCEDILNKMEGTIQENASDPMKLEKDIAIFMVDIIPSKDCIKSSIEFKKKFNTLKRKVMEVLNHIEDAEESEY